MDKTPVECATLGRFGQLLARRRAARWALLLLFLLHGLAIFAPLLAGDRPYAMRAIDLGGYRANLRTLAPVAGSVERLARKQPEQYRGGRVAWEAALQSELLAADQRVERLARGVAPASAEAFYAYRGELDSAVSQALSGQSEAAERSAQQALAHALQLRVSHAPKSPGSASEGQGIELFAETRFPLFEALSGVEVACMLLWLCLAAGLGRALWPRRSARAKGYPALRTGLGCLLVCSLLGALWGSFVGGTPAFEEASYKAHLDSGELRAEWVLFPPLAFGFAEAHLGEKFCAPSWAGGGAGLVEGRLEDQDFELGAERAPAIPVEVRRAEPGLNSPWRHLLGTDGRGRDLLVRLLWGARVSLGVGLSAALLMVLIGSLIGALAGYFGGRIDFWISRLIEVVQCFPAFFLILLVLAFWDPKSLPPIIAIVLVLALVRWTGVARLTRAEFLRLRERPFALAARAAGLSHGSIILRQLLPNALGPILVAGTYLVGSGLLTESALSFLGFGVQVPIPSWGSLINESRSAEHWWIQLFPGFLIFLTVLSYNLLGEALRDALDPRGSVR